MTRSRASIADVEDDLRPSAASLLIAGGFQLAGVSMLLAHSELRVTTDFYTQLQEQTAAKAPTHGRGL
jgi:site-specific recombinase XerD